MSVPAPLGTAPWRVWGLQSLPGAFPFLSPFCHVLIVVSVTRDTSVPRWREETSTKRGPETKTCPLSPGGQRGGMQRSQGLAPSAGPRGGSSLPLPASGGPGRPGAGGHVPPVSASISSVSVSPLFCPLLGHCNWVYGHLLQEDSSQTPHGVPSADSQPWASHVSLLEETRHLATRGQGPEQLGQTAPGHRAPGTCSAF